MCTGAQWMQMRQEPMDMLILTRRPTQTLTIGSEVTVTVLEIRGNRVRIGVNAPREIAVLRVERAEKARSRRPTDVDH
jgi:carbon storage regulator